MKQGLLLPLIFLCSVIFIAYRNLPGESVVTQPSLPSTYLFPVKASNDKIGFIDSAGTLIVQPIYESAQEFNEGSCAVRKDGRYGFINLKGEMVIKPEYDYATKFQEGLALVHLKGKPCFIDYTGKVVIAPCYSYMTAFTNGRSHVITKTEKAGVINNKGKLVIDTIYRYIDPFVKGVTKAILMYPPDKKHEQAYYEQTLIDSLGTQLVKPGQFDNIVGPFEGYYIADLVTNHSDVLLDRKGHIVRRFDKRDFVWSQSGIGNNIINLSRSERRNDSNETYEVYTTLEGKLIFGNEQIWGAETFQENFAFCRDETRDFLMINRKGKILARFDELISKGFNNGIALVKKGTWGLIDTTGHFISQTSFKEIHSIGIVGDFIFPEEPDYDYTTRRAPKYGFADRNGEVIVQPTFEYFDQRGFNYGLIKTSVSDRITFFNKKGKIVWQEDSLKDQKYPLNIDYMQRCYFSVEHDGTGHPSARGVTAKPITSALPYNFPEQLRVMVYPEHNNADERAPYKTMSVFITNATHDTVVFNAQDGRIKMITQARDESGKWKDIDYMPRSWCGNSYHSVALPDNYYWQLPMPTYEGSFKTRLRLALTYVDPLDTTDAYRYRSKDDGRSRYDVREITIYSNEFECSINPGQFWRVAAYARGGIMDPYE